MAAAGTTVAASTPTHDVVLVDHLRKMYPHGLDGYHIPERTEPSFSVRDAEDVDNLTTGVMLRNAAHVVRHATLGHQDLAAFEHGKGYVASNVAEVVGPGYSSPTAGVGVPFSGIPQRDAVASIDIERVLASQATLRGRLESVVDVEQTTSNSRFSWKSGLVAALGSAGLTAGVASVAASVGDKPLTYILATAVGVGALAGAAAARLGYRSRSSENAGAQPNQVYSDEIGQAVSQHYTHLLKLRDALDVKIRQTDAEMMERLNAPFDEKRAREDLHYLPEAQRNAEVDTQRDTHIGTQKSLMAAVVLYAKVKDQLNALKPVVDYKRP